MSHLFLKNRAYKEWFSELKSHIQKSQLKAVVQLNTAMLEMYWEIGLELIKKQKQLGWGSAVVSTLAEDLQKEFPEMKGFSERNLFYMQNWVEFYLSEPKLQQVVAVLEKPSAHTRRPKKSISKTEKPSKHAAKLQQAVAVLEKPSKHAAKLQQAVAEIRNMLVQIPWGHHIMVLAKVKKREEALWYIEQTIENGWSRNVLQHHIESDLYQRQKKVQKVHNFKNTLPAGQSDLAEKTLKDPYIFDFLRIGSEVNERELENELTKYITQFLLELGKGFAYMGKQYHLEIGDDDFYIDLLFYNLQLRCYVVIELKTGKFEPADAGQVLFYTNAIDKKLKTKNDNPTVGLIICKDKNKVVAEYALNNIKKPIGVSEYKLTQAIPKEIKTALPTIGELEEEINNYLKNQSKKKK